MTDRVAPRIIKWPFFFGDALLLASAGWLVFHNTRPLDLWIQVLVITCVVGAAWLGVWPFVEEYRALVKFAESNHLASTIEQIDKVESAAEQIRAATAQWQGVQEHAGRTVTAARELSEQMARERTAFQDFLQRANDAERSHLRLEVEKLRRGEGEWLQMVVHLLDHVHALHNAALRSGQSNVIGQLTQFQNACRDVVRRAGIGAIDAQPGHSFDATVHQTLEGKKAPPGAVVAEALAPGISFQGQLVRRCLVRLDTAGEAAIDAVRAPAEQPMSGTASPAAGELDPGTPATPA